MQQRQNASIVSNSTPSGASPFLPTGMVTGMALQPNAKRAVMFVQNIHTGTPLYVLFGNGTASTGNFSMILFQGERLFNDFWKGPVCVSGAAFQAWDM